MNSRPRWWSGGLAGAVSQSIVAPFDLLETRLVYEKKHYSLLQSASYAIRKHGFISLFDGLSAQILRQLTYTTLRFYLYSRGREDKFTFKQKIFLATFSGIVSSSVGIPMELINTRMQMDRVIKDKYKRKYRNVFHGLYRVWKDEGVTGLYTGGSYSLARGALMAIGQNAVYDHAKTIYLDSYHLEDGFYLHLISSTTAGIVVAPLLQPLEVIKTVHMIARAGYLPTISDKLKFILRFGPKGLFRGLSASMCRLVPNTIIMFILYEQLRQRFGYVDEPESKLH